MKRLYSALLISTFTIGLSAQPVYNDTDINPQVGDSYLEHAVDYTNTAPGAMMSWDISSLSSNGTSTVQFLAPNNFPNSTQFSGANVAVGVPNGAQFYQATPVGFYNLGNTDGTLIIPYTDSEQWFQYPMTYNNSLIDGFAGNYMVAGNPVTRAGLTTVLVDGYGDLVLPWGTVNNVLRLKMNREMTDSSSFMGQPIVVNYNDEIVAFVKAGIHYWLASFSKNMSSGITGVVNDSSGTYIDQSASINENLFQTIGIDVYPNPSSDVLTVNYSADAGNAIRFEIMNSLGQIVMSDTYSNPSNGISQEVLDISALPSGLYTLSINDGKGESGTKNFVVNR